jgi:hypothetical protein
MPVSVHVPSRIVVDPRSLAGRQACVEEAFGQAMARALERSRRHVLKPRAGYVGARLNSPEFRWSGEAVSSVPAEERARFEAKVRAYILEQVGATGLLTSVRQKKRAPLAGPAFEPFDPTRYRPVLDLYDIPVYNDAGKKHPARVLRKKAAKAPVEYVEQDVWFKAPNRLIDNWNLYIKRLRAMLDGWNIAPEGVRGMLWREPTRWVLSVHDDDRWYGWVSWSNFTERRVKVVNGKPDFARVTVAPPVGVATARVVTAADVREQMKSDIRAALLEHQQRKGPIGFEFSQQLDEKVEAELSRSFTIDLGATVIEINAGGVVNWVYTPNPPVWSGTATLAPLTQVVKVKKEPEPEEEGEKEGEGVGPGEGAPEAGGAGGGLGKGKDGGKAEGKKGAVVYTGEEGAGEGGLFPGSATGAEIEACKTPFNGEPKLDELGADGELLRKLIEEIAFKLQIPACPYAARFATVACRVQGGRAMAVSDYAMEDHHIGFVQPLEPKPGSVSTFDFIPAVSPGVQFMRHLATVTPRITHLTHMIDAIYGKPEHVAKVIGDRYASYTGWFIDFGSTMNGLQKRATGSIFAATCRVVLMQLLRSSQKGIKDRLANLDAYARIFEELIKLQLADITELTALRDRLRREVIDKDLLKELGEEIMTTWQEARRALVATLEFRNPFSGIVIGPEQIVTAPDGTKGIKDSKGRVWSLDQLDRAIALQRDVVNQLDPLIPQITLDPDLLARFTRNPDGTREELERLLREMEGHNARIIAENRSDRKYGFRASGINRNTAGRTIPGTDYQLTGVHAMTHELIGEFFGGDLHYAMSVNALLKAQEGWEDFKMLAEFVGVTLLAIFCYPLAFAVGGVLAIYHHHEAQEKKELFQALLDPELVITRAEVEAELFAAELGLLLSFIPDAGPILRAGARLGRGVIRGEARAAARALTRRLARRITADMIKALKGNLAESFVKALLSAQVMNMFLGKLLIEPAIAQMQRDLATYEQIVAMANRP